jgi:catechol 1,2-dioxygenase
MCVCRLVDEITQEKLVGSSYKTTRSAILGPFFRNDTPPTKNDASIVLKKPADGEVTYMHGIVRDAVTGAPVAGVTVDIWQCSTNGLYEQQDPEQPDFNLRGKLTTDANGYYGVYCLRPVPYPVPDDGPAGQLLNLLDRHPYRPAHIHIIVRSHNNPSLVSSEQDYLTNTLPPSQAGSDDYSPLTTQIFDRSSKYLDDDSVFAVKDDLIVDFKPLTGHPEATLELTYDITLYPTGSQ